MKQTAIITGASSGIGAAIAFALAGSNIHVILLARNRAKLTSVANTILSSGGLCTCYQCDITKRKDIETALEDCKQQISASQLMMINNAGYGGPFHRTDEVSEEEWDLIFDTNVKAAFLFCKKLLPLMKENNWGRIINISSIYGQTGGAYSSAYAASKHALVGYTKSLAVEWGKYNITSNIISPGFTDTGMGASADEAYYANVMNQIPSQRQGTPDEIARLVLFLISNESSYINGADIVIDGGLLAGRSFT